MTCPTAVAGSEAGPSRTTRSDSSAMAAKRCPIGGHLSAAHRHPHDHAELSHAHLPHRHFEEEHAGEAHVHDHAAPAGNG